MSCRSPTHAVHHQDLRIASHTTRHSPATYKESRYVHQKIYEHYKQVTDVEGQAYQQNRQCQTLPVLLMADYLKTNNSNRRRRDCPRQVKIYDYPLNRFSRPFLSLSFSFDLLSSTCLHVRTSFHLISLVDFVRCSF